MGKLIISPKLIILKQVFLIKRQLKEEENDRKRSIYGYDFLEQFYERTGSDDIAVLLGAVILRGDEDTMILRCEIGRAHV